MRLQRTHYCGKLGKNNTGETVTVAGWIDSRRDHGGLIFVDLRDRYGILQVVFNQEFNHPIFSEAESLRPEFVISVRGEVVPRSPETINPKLDTGEIEIAVTQLEILNTSRTPPFYIEDGIDTDENLRFAYRYLDLRRPEMFKLLKLRHNMNRLIREYLDREGFLEIETPILTRSTPEGARDYLVPSRTSPGNFYALPQSPQLFKQLLMVAGVDRYYQIARCFRDEDLRADRQPEFTQIDLEMSFSTRQDVLEVVEGLIFFLFQKVLKKELKTPFPVYTYDQVMERYGSDRPDLRFGMEIKDISLITRESDFKVFKNVLQRGGVVKGLLVKGAGSFSRKELDDLTLLVQSWGTGGLAWMICSEEGFKTPISKFFTAGRLKSIKEIMEAETGDLLLFVADSRDKALSVLGQLRLYLAEQLKLIPDGVDSFHWVVDFPLFTYDDEEKRLTSNHHPFTAPLYDDLHLLSESPEKVRSQAYDLVYNGVEVAGGSIRIHQRAVQEQVFKMLCLDEEEAEEKFGFLLRAFQYGAPPHGGIAFGLDRLIMLMAGRKSIRDIIPFPKTAAGSCLLTGAPAPVSPGQLEDIRINIIPGDNKKSFKGS